MSGSINNLPYLDTVTAATSLACNINNQDFQVLPDVLNTYLATLSSTSSGLVIQYSAPSATGFSVQVNDASSDVWLVLTPLAGYATGTLVLPAVAHCTSGQRIIVNTTQAVTTLTITGNGSSVTGAPTTLAANAFFELKWEPVLKTWYRVG
jgi:hypothetical protein